MGCFKEALKLDLLEDFNATEADLMELKDEILTAWKSRDKHKTLSLGPTFIPSSVRASEKKKSTLGDTFSPSSATALAPIHSSIFSGSSYAIGGTQSPLVRPMTLPPGILHPSVSVSYGQGVSHSKLFLMGIHPRIQLQSHDGAILETSGPK